MPSEGPPKIDSDPTAVVILLGTNLLIYFISTFFEHPLENCAWNKTDAFKLDSFLLDRELLLGVVTSAFASILGCALAPIYYWLGGSVYGIDAVSLPNVVHSDSGAVGVIVPVAYLLAGMLCYLLEREATVHSVAHLRYVKSLGSGASNVLIDDLPLELRDSETLSVFLAEQLGQGTVVDVRHSPGDTCAFVNLATFQAVLDARELGSCVTKFVPDASDIIFSNFGPYTHNVRRAAMDASYIAVLMYWHVPVTWLESLLCYENVRVWSGLPKIPRFVHEFIDGYVPIFFLILMLLMFYPVLGFFCHKFERRRCWSEIQSVVTGRIYGLCLMTVCTTVFSRPYMIGVHYALGSPENALMMLSEALTDVGMYFIYLMLAMITFLTLFNICVNIPPIWERIHGGFFIFPYEWVVPSLQFAFTILMTYAPLYPFLAWESLVFFVFARRVYNKALLLHPVSRVSSACVWDKSLEMHLLAAFLGALVLIGVALLSCVQRGTCGLSSFLLPIPISIVLFWRRLHTRLQSIALSLEVSNRLDQSIRH